jgi:hypothetical protein
MTQVFISLLLQISIAIIVCLALAGLELWPSNKEKRERDHSHALATALVEYKNQCYFISAIEIAALALGRQTAALGAMNQRALPRFDLMLSIPLSMNGFVPIIFTLTFISRYGRLSWYIIILSVVTIALLTGSLATTFAEGFVYDVNGQYLLELGDLICGSSSSILQGAINPININLPLFSAIYSNCIVCGLWCIAKHISDRQPKGSHLGRALKACKKVPLKITRNRPLREIFRP